ncbi:MAG: M48 family metallopeptidase [Gemmatimonadota bacterium]|nr:MAG: M48 family metallopeptidase [Gemmatimonadota bacterium]
MSADAGVPTERSRVVLTNISATAWEHPADRAALQTLRAIPGFDEVVRRIFGFFGERGIRLLFQANAVRVGPKQFPQLHGLLTEVTTTMDWHEQPELYVTQTPFVNAGAVGMDHPFITLNSGAVTLLDEDELRVLIGHELGHVMSGHALYRTVLFILLMFGFNNLPFLAGVALLPIQLALLEWSRKAELSSDRAGLLATQDPVASMRVFLKLAGGGTAAETDLDAFMEQAREYDTMGGPMDKVYKILNTLSLTHPFNTLRAAELQKWISDGSYDKIVQGEYTHRGEEEKKRSVVEDVGEAATHYAKSAKETVGDVADAVKRAAAAFTDAFRESDKK